MATEASRAIKLYGTESADPPTRTLRAGALSVELDNGALRYVRFGGVEVLRAIAFLVRDENWGTFAPTIENLAVDESSDGFSVSYRATCSDPSQKLVFEARIAGRPDGSLDFEVVADPITDVRTNRTGFTVLHPLVGVAGERVKVLHTDGTEEDARFPEAIDPVQPFLDIRALSHQVVPGVWATCTMEGDAFEMEDQRNWSDASYKTYVRPLALPWPYTLTKGEKATQAVRLSFSGEAQAAATTGDAAGASATIGAETGAVLPAVGIGVPADEAQAALDAIDLVRKLGPRWLVCEVDRRRDHGVTDLRRYRRLAEATGAETTLEIVIPGGPDPESELAAVAADVRASGLAPAAISVFPAQDMKSVLPGSPWPPVPSFAEIYAAARKAFPGVRLGGGMATYFTELNRKRPPADLIDYVTHTTCPTVHAADDLSVMETLQSLRYITLSTRSFMGDIPYRVGPSALGCRENAYGAATAPNPDNRRVCLSRIDPRQRGLFNGAWTLGYVSELAKGGVEAVALGAPTGSFGAIHRKADFVQPFFDDLDGPAVHPVFHVLASLTAAAGRPVLSIELEGADRVAALACRDGDATVLWLANLTAARQEVAIAGLPSSGARIAVIDETSFATAASDPDAVATLERPLDGDRVSLDAYAVAIVRAPS